MVPPPGPGPGSRQPRAPRARGDGPGFSSREKPLEALPDSVALIGISTDGRAIAVDIGAAPHIRVCSGTGGGSTTILRTLTA
ncbi:hypothetical protein ABZ589_35055 [Streptomyces sp. NPDC013313]|uniref:hypothetical protein n=1 Tax=Streptomyces sp. NPDC013313 TaxID=3155603 RepID=UPI0033FFE811